MRTFSSLDLRESWTQSERSSLLLLCVLSMESTNQNHINSILGLNGHTRDCYARMRTDYDQSTMRKYNQIDIVD